MYRCSCPFVNVSPSKTYSQSKNAFSVFPKLNERGALIKLPFSLASLQVVITGSSSISMLINRRACRAINSDSATIKAIGCPQK